MEKKKKKKNPHLLQAHQAKIYKSDCWFIAVQVSGFYSIRWLWVQSELWHLCIRERVLGREGGKDSFDHDSSCLHLPSYFSFWTLSTRVSMDLCPNIHTSAHESTREYAEAKTEQQAHTVFLLVWCMWHAALTACFILSWFFPSLSAMSFYSLFFVV